MTEFKERLKELRNSKNYTQQQLADLVYVSRSTVAKWESGLILPSDEYLAKLCEVFAVERETLFKDTEQEQLNSRKNRTIFRQKTTIWLMCGALAILLALAVVLPIVVSNNKKPGSQDYIKLTPPAITLKGAGAEGNLSYAAYGITRGPFVVTAVVPAPGQAALQKMTVNPAPAGGAVTMTTDFAYESVSAYYFEITNDLLYLVEGKPYDPGTRNGWFQLDFATPLTVTGSAPTCLVTLPEVSTDKLLLRLELTVCGETFRYFVLFEN